MMYTSVITQKGQTTIPIKIRNRFGLEKGDKIMFVEKNNKIFLEPAVSFIELKG